MKKYLSALALGGLLCSASIAYGVDKPVIEPINQPANQPTIETQEICNMITKAEFYTMLMQSVGSDINMLIEDDLSTNEPINYAEAIKTCEFIENPFLTEQSELAHNSNTALTPQDAKTMLDDFTSHFNLKENEKNDQGVSYALTPLNNGYKFELEWGKKPSSGYNIEIKDTKTVGDILYVSYVTSEPKSGAAYLTVITYPNDSVVIEAKKLPNKVVMINESSND